MLSHILVLYVCATEQELGVSVPLLTPGDNKMMNRISSSIIRELSSNMLIPYTRLKLLECIGQGKEILASSPGHSQLFDIAILKSWKWPRDEAKEIINARRMREGYCNHPVCLSVCLSVCLLPP